MTFKGTLLFALSIFILVVSNSYSQGSPSNNQPKLENEKLYVGAERLDLYLSKIQNKNIGIVTNQTGILPNLKNINIVDFLIGNNINITSIYAPEHGFRGTADAGEHIQDGKDISTGIPIKSLYGNNKKPSPEQLKGIDVMIFDLQDVGARFYTYISTLHYVMEACAEQNIPLIVMDRPNPICSIIDGPMLEEEHKSFVGMHPIPVLHGMTIGEYAQMINGEGWLKDKVQCSIEIIPIANYNRSKVYSLPVRPSPNLPNDQSINLYASLCFFEGTNISVGRGTSLQFQQYGSPNLKNYNYSFTPIPNFGAKDPLHKNKLCYGENLSEEPILQKLELKWLIKAYTNTTEPTKFFNTFFTKLAGTKKLEEQIRQGLTEKEIRATWQKDLEQFKKTRSKYLLYH